MRILKTLAFAPLLMLAFCITLPAQNVEDDIRLLRSDISADKTAILTANMKLSEADSAKFWPLQRQYEADLAKIGDKRIAIIKDYAANYEKLTPAKANELGTGALKLEAETISLRQRYFGLISKAVSPMAAARYMQMEAQLQRLVDLQRASAIPLVK